ncbi:MAG: hypothetical protein ACOC4A_00585 [Spirochaetota bacterium]
MASQIELDLVVLAFAPPGTASSQIPALAHYLNASVRFRSTPVTWSLPSLGALDNPSVTAAVRSRVDSVGDGVATAGYTGVTHSLLLAAELEPECALGLSNREKSGILDVFPGVDPVLLAPAPDPRRPEAASVYAGHFRAFTRGIVPPTGRAPARILFTVGGHAWSLPALICGPEARESSMSAHLRLIERRRPGGAVIILQADAANAVEPLDAALDRLTGTARAARIMRFDHAWVSRTGDRTTATPPATETGACRMPRVQTSDAVGALRADASVSPETVLRQLQEERAASRYETPCDGSPPASRTIHASMMGSATLEMDACAVQFSRGRLSRFARSAHDRRAQLLADDVSGFMRTRELTYSLTTESAFSFEESAIGVRGLMAVFSLGRDSLDAPGRLLVDYTAIGDFPWLIIELCFEFPVPGELDTVEELIPFALPLRMPEQAEDQMIATQYPDGSGSRIDLRGVTGSGCVFGSLLQFGSHFTISRIEPQPGVTGAFRFDVRRGITGSALTLYPLGRFGARDLAERAGTTSRVRIAVSPAQRDYSEIVHAPAEARRQHVPSASTD